MSDTTFVRYVGVGPRRFGQPGYGSRFFGAHPAGFAGPWAFGPARRPLKKSEARIVKRLHALAVTLASSRANTTKAQRRQLAQALDRALADVNAVLDANESAPSTSPADATG